MSFWNSVHVKHARKPHMCEFCSVIIVVGNSCFHESGTWEGEFNDYYLCERCEGLISSGGIWYDGGELSHFCDIIGDTGITKCPYCKSIYYDYITWSKDMLSGKVDCMCGEAYEINASLENLLAITK